MPSSSRARYWVTPTFRRTTAGAGVDQDYNVTKNPSSLDQFYGISNFSWPTTILVQSVADATVFPPLAAAEGSPYPYSNFKTWIDAKYRAALIATERMGWWTTVQIANGGGGWNDLIQTGQQGISSVYPLQAFVARRNASYQATRTALSDGLGAWIFAIPASTYSIPVCELLNEIQYHLMEEPNGGASFGSGLWSVPEVLAYLNNRISRFLMETGCLQYRTTQAALAADEFYNLPEDLIDLRRVAWDNGSGNINVLPRGDSLQADLYYSSWDTTGAGIPQIHTQIPDESLEIKLAPNPSADGTLEFIYVKDAPTVTNDCSIMPLPDEWVPFVKWGVISDMLAKEGEANDVKRAQYAESRYTDGVQLARLYLGANV